MALFYTEWWSGPVAGKLSDRLTGNKTQNQNITQNGNNYGNIQRKRKLLPTHV